MIFCRVLMVIKTARSVPGYLPHPMRSNDLLQTNAARCVIGGTIFNVHLTYKDCWELGSNLGPSGH